MRFITETELRAQYARTPFQCFVLDDDARLTPGARQFLIDFKITWNDDTYLSTHKTHPVVENTQKEETDNVGVQHKGACTHDVVDTHTATDIMLSTDTQERVPCACAVPACCPDLAEALQDEIVYTALKLQELALDLCPCDGACAERFYEIGEQLLSVDIEASVVQIAPSTMPGRERYCTTWPTIAPKNPQSRLVCACKSFDAFLVRQAHRWYRRFYRSYRTSPADAARIADWLAAIKTLRASVHADMQGVCTDTEDINTASTHSIHTHAVDTRSADEHVTERHSAHTCLLERHTGGESHA